MVRKRRNRIRTPPPPDNRISIGVSREVTYTRTPNPDDNYDKGTTDTDWHFDGTAKLIDGPECYDLALGFTPDPDKTYYLVVVIYSTGDSFGQEDHGRYTPLEVFRTFEEAEALGAAIKDHYEWYSLWHGNGRRFTPPDKAGIPKDKYSEKNSYSVPLPDGTEIYAGSWCGYFDRLEEVRIIPLKIT